MLYLLGGTIMHQQKVSSRTTMLSISAAGSSDKGRRREQNEDAIALCEPSDQLQAERLGRLYLLADGAGGHAAGEVASRLAVETIASVYYASFERTGQSQGLLRRLRNSFSAGDTPFVRIQQAFLAAHTRIRQLATLEEEYAGMATTCIAALVKETGVLIAHIGDSRAYLIQGTPSAPTTTCLTTDHSMAVEMARAGILFPEQIYTSTCRHILVRILGGDDANIPSPDIMACNVCAGDHLVLCCDGLWSMLTEAQIAQVVSRNSPQDACAELIRLANEAGGPDNVSVVVISFGERTA
jgi:serine/threonine protein phosphatase PrpC